MHSIVVVVEVAGIGLLIHPLLIAVHVLQVLDVVGVFQRLALLGLGKVGEDHVAVDSGTIDRPLPHVHQVHVIVGVQTIGVVGIVSEQADELGGRGVIVLKFVLENDTHVVEALLNHVVSCLNLFFGAGNLLEIELLVVRVFGTLECLLVHGD